MNEAIVRKVASAKIFGQIAFARGAKAVPALDANVLPLMAGVKPGEALPILKAWAAGWHEANMAAPIVVEYDAAALAERAAAGAAAKAADASAQRQLANKARADAEVGEFVLCGSNRPIDIAAAHGQKDLF